MKRLGFKVLRFTGIALASFAFVRLTLVHPGPSPDLLLPIAAKQCSAVLKMRCTAVFE